MKKIVLVALIIFIASTGAAVEVTDDLPSLSVVFKEETQIYSIEVRNTQSTPRKFNIRARGAAAESIDIPDTVEVPANGVKNIPVTIKVSKDTKTGIYVGEIEITGVSTSEKIPVGIRVINREASTVNIDIQTTAKTIRPDQNITVLTVLSSSKKTGQNLTIDYELRKGDGGNLIHNKSRIVQISEVKSFKEKLNPNRSLSIGSYYMQAHLRRENSTLTATDTFNVSNPFWNAFRIKIGLLFAAIGITMGGGLYTRKWYKEHREEESRYVFPVDYNKLPNDGENMFEVGKIAETQKTAYIDPKDLTTHAIVSGSTGSGKSVTANVIAEEALENDIPVIVFDPTAQWTGFVKELKDGDLKEHYQRFDMDEEEAPHPYPGIIKEISSDDPDINFEEIREPGEITVFTLNNLTTEQFDQAVRKIIGQIFEKDWEESPTLEMLIVFDEVHRLLEEYGGEGGYKALEKGAREFRKWGIGLMMCSQVTADFKQAISGNIMTELQMQTKSMEDINRVEKKYGEQFSKRISSEDVGTGMIQNSNYNDGEPWFVDFRPTYHNPHKIPDEELKKYHKLSSELDKLKTKIKEMEEEGNEMRDKKLELNLAEDKLKEGRFKMANMYIDSLKDELGIS